MTNDQRLMLRIKLASLGHEARVIRRHENRLLRRRGEKGWRELQAIATRMALSGNLLEASKATMREERTARRARKASDGAHRLAASLRRHRTVVVRVAARQTLLAYSFIRGRTYEQIETKARTRPDWPEVWRMVKTYGASETEAPAVLRERFSLWLPGGALESYGGQWKPEC